MRCSTMILWLPVAARVFSKEAAANEHQEAHDLFVEKMVDKLVSSMSAWMLGASPRPRTDLANATLGKLGHFVMSRPVHRTLLPGRAQLRSTSFDSAPPSQPQFGGNATSGFDLQASGSSWNPQFVADYVRRALLVSGIVLGSNFFGATSRLASLNVEGSRALRIDSYVPVAGLKRCFKPESGFEFVYPEDYVADLTLFRRQQRVKDLANNPDGFSPQELKELNQPRSKIFGQDVYEPSVGFGPQGGQGEESLSCIVSPMARDFNLAVFGDAESQAKWLLGNVIAPPGSGKVAELIGASQGKRTEGAEGVEYYSLEYTVETPKWKRHNVAVFAQRDQKLYTFNAQIPESKWGGERARQLKAAQETFRLLPASV